jgi:hypothetical protein
MSQLENYKETKTVNVFKEDESSLEKSKRLEELFKSVAYKARKKEREEIINTLEGFIAPHAENTDENLVLFLTGIHEAIELVKNKNNKDKEGFIENDA